MRTLLLDSSYLPVEVISWKRAIVLWLTGRAELVDDYENVVIHSPNHDFRLPKILRLFRIHKSKKSVKFSRFNVLYRDKFQCQYCAVKLPPKKLTLDHILPISRGGRNSWENVVTACQKCNGKKGSYLPEECGMKLLRPPRPPSWSPQIVVRMREDDPQEWKLWMPRSKKLAG